MHKSAIKWDANTPHADNFAFKGNFVCKVYDDRLHQLVAKHPLKGSVTIKATMKKYSGQYATAFGLLTERRRNEQCSGIHQ